MARNEHQRKWQRAALEMLMAERGNHDRGPWVPAGQAKTLIQERAGCTHQAALGALRALLTAGLADRSETYEGEFWRATDAAMLVEELFLVPFLAELRAIEERLEGVDQSMDQVLWLQGVREKLESARRGSGA